MNVTFALFADGANLSQEGKLNILGVFDAVQVATLPAVHPRAHLVVHLKGSPVDAGAHSVTLRWLNPDVNDNTWGQGDASLGFKVGVFTDESFLATFQLRATSPSSFQKPTARPAR